MLYSEKLTRFAAAHPCETMTVDGAVFRYVLSGRADGRTLVLLNGGMDAETLKSLKKKYFFAPVMLWYMKDYPQEKDVHISGLLADLMRQTPVTAEDFAALRGKILLILPNQDFFSGAMQQDLIRLMHEPKIAYVSGGHLSTILKAEDYIRTIRNFLNSIGA